MSLNSEGENFYRFNQSFFQKKALENNQNIISRLKNLIKSFFIFNFSFCLLFLLQFISLMFSFVFLEASTLIALLLAGIFLTVFTYFVLLFYFQSKKPEQLALLQKHFIQVNKKSLSIPPGTAEHHLTIALAATKLCEKLSKTENEFLKLPNFISIISLKINSYLLKEDLFKFKELLLIAAIKEHLQQIRLTPTDLEVHSSLANIYSTLSGLYLDAKNNIYQSKNAKSILNQKYNSCTVNAIEEFKILNEYAPNDPWIHLQLAQNYQKLKFIKAQIKEYEIIYKLSPNDNAILFKLGSLYFETKNTAKGLKVYEELKIRSYDKAEDLLSYYGIYNNLEDLEGSYQKYL